MNKERTQTEPAEKKGKASQFVRFVRRAVRVIKKSIKSGHKYSKRIIKKVV